MQTHEAVTDYCCRVKERIKAQSLGAHIREALHQVAIERNRPDMLCVELRVESKIVPLHISQHNYFTDKRENIVKVNGSSVWGYPKDLGRWQQTHDTLQSICLEGKDLQLAYVGLGESVHEIHTTHTLLCGKLNATCNSQEWSLHGEVVTNVAPSK